MTIDEVLAALRLKCDEAGSQNAWAQAVGVTGAYVSDVLNKRREPGKSILDPLGLEKRVTYEPKLQTNRSRNPKSTSARKKPKRVGTP